MRPQVPGGAPAGGKPPALAAPPPASPASPASITSNATASYSVRQLAPGRAASHRACLHPKITKAGQTLREALAPVTSAATEVIEKFRELPGRPAEIEIHFGAKLDAAMGAVIATTTVGTHLDVTLRWSCRPMDANEAQDDPP